MTSSRAKENSSISRSSSNTKVDSETTKNMGLEFLRIKKTTLDMKVSFLTISKMDVESTSLVKDITKGNLKMINCMDMEN